MGGVFKLENIIEKYWCSLFPKGIVILSDGKMTTCCLDALGKNSYANIYQQDLLTILEQTIPEILERGLQELTACKECIGKNGLTSLISNSGEYKPWENISHSYPEELIIEVASWCNYGCCIAKELHNYRRESQLDLAKVFKQIKPLLTKISRIKLFNYGEPLLNKGLGDFILSCRKTNNDLILTLATNGFFMNESISKTLIEGQVNQVVVSVHGGPGTENMLKYANYGADYKRVIANIEELLNLRKLYASQLPKISLRAILFAWNDSDDVMDQLRGDAQRLGLQTTWGNLDTDNYHWILDEGKGGLDRSSKRFTPGNKELQKLIYQKELFVKEFW